MAIMVLLSIALNSYWMLLMIKMIARVIMRARGTANQKHEPNEKIELVKADALAERQAEEEEYDNNADGKSCGSSTQGSNAGDRNFASHHNEFNFNVEEENENGG